MSFRKPFRSKPIVPGPIYLARVRKQRRRRTVLTWLAGLGIFAGVFAGGMAITNWSAVSGSFGTGKPGTTTFRLCGMIRQNCIVDGDTFWIKGEKVRIANIDAPETPGSDRCKHLRTGKNPSWCDVERGLKARDTLRDFLSSGPVSISRQGEDQYGRTLATVSVDGKDAGSHLVNQGVARWWQN